MFSDKRSKKVIMVAHCILNQNAKIDRCAYYPGVIKEVANILIDANIGILQMPCPEFLILGLDRQIKRENNPTIESEDTRVARRMNEKQSINSCRKLVNNIIYQMEEYKKNGFELIGVIGINGSPTCGLETTWSNNLEEPGSGVFIRILAEECHKKSIVLPMRGIKANESHQAIVTIQSLLNNALNS